MSVCEGSPAPVVRLLLLGGRGEFDFSEDERSSRGVEAAIGEGSSLLLGKKAMGERDWQVLE